MKDPRRLIDSATPGSAHQHLLQAGRNSAPSAAATQQLLDAALPLFSSGASVAAGASAGKLAASKLAASKLGLTGVAAKCVALLVAGAAGTGIWLAMKSGDSPNGIVNASKTAAMSSTPTKRDVPPKEEVASPASTVLEGNEGAASAIASSEQEQPAAHAEAGTSGAGKSRARARKSAKPTLRGSHKLTSSVAPAAAAEVQHRSSADGAPAAATAAAPAAQADPAAKTAPAPQQTSLKQELRELDAVRATLLRGDRESAQRLLSIYFAAHPHGYLAPEARRLERQLARTSGD